MEITHSDVHGGLKPPRARPRREASSGQRSPTAVGRASGPPPSFQPAWRGRLSQGTSRPSQGYQPHAGTSLPPPGLPQATSYSLSLTHRRRTSPKPGWSPSPCRATAWHPALTPHAPVGLHTQCLLSGSSVLGQGLLESRRYGPSRGFLSATALGLRRSWASSPRAGALQGTTHSTPPRNPGPTPRLWL